MRGKEERDMWSYLDSKLIALSIVARNGLRSFITDEDGAVDIVAIVVLIGIVVLVAVVFREQLEKLVEKLFSTIGQTAEDAIKPQ